MTELNRLDAPELHRRLMRHIFQEGQATRQSLVEALGCTLLTVSKAVTALLEEGLLVVDGTMSSAAGRRKSILKINPRAKMCLCADIGYGSVKIALIRLNGEVEKKVVLPGNANPLTDGVPFDEMLRIMDAMIAETGREKILGIGVGISGMVQYETGTVLFCPNIAGFEDRPLADELSARFGLPVLVDTSARCMAMGEYHFGAGRGVPDQICLSLGIGSIAAGIIADGRLYRGPAGFAGEVGHNCVRPGANRERCTCGGYDCLELYATLQMLCNNIGDALHVFDGYSSAKKLLGSEKLTLDRLREVVALGDPIVDELFTGAINDISSVLVGVVNLFTPSVVVLGGGLPRFLPEAVGELRRRVLASCLTPMRTRLNIIPSGLGEDGSLRGAAGMLIDHFLGEG